MNNDWDYSKGDGEESSSFIVGLLRSHRDVQHGKGNLGVPSSDDFECKWGAHI